MHVANLMSQYESAFTMENPPLLVAWLSFDFVKELETDVVSGLETFLTSEGFSFQGKHAAPRVVWLESRPEVVKSLNVFATQDKRQLVGLSQREFLYVTADYDRFQSTLDFVQSIVTTMSPRDVEVSNLQLNYYNVFESGGLTTDLVIESVQGPPPVSRAAHEHRRFVLSTEVDGCWFHSNVEYRHGDKYKPEIRSGVESRLAFSPKFKVDRQTHCFVIDLRASNIRKMSMLECAPAMVHARSLINRMFLSLVTAKAYAQWQIEKK